MIVVVDYRMGNLGSVMNMLNKIGAQAISSSESGQIKNADKLILPGVGAFDNGIKNLTELGLIDVLNDKVTRSKTPILGICLGMQLFTNRSEEGNSSGLGWIDAETVKFNFDENPGKLKIPHMGWNTVKIARENALFRDMYPDSRFYFVHSYHVNCKNEEDVSGRSFHGYNFASLIIKENIAGVQFHPEKSHKFGMRILKNFAERF